LNGTRKSLSNNERLDWLRLIRSENVGPITFHRLLERYGSAARALDALPELAAKGGARRIRIASKTDTAAEMEQVAASGVQLIALAEEHYPPLLRQTEDAPPLIAVIGHPHLLVKKALAVVGGRNASANGLGLAERLARDVGAEGYLIVSGMARGVLVVEATQKSGSLITARFAAEQNREVFAVPGSPLDPRTQGANQLIKEGAHLVQSAADIMEILSGLFQSNLEEPQAIENIDENDITSSPGDVDAGRDVIKKLLGPTPIAVDELIRRCQMSLAVVSMVLLELELAGRLERHPGNQVSTIGEI